MSADSHQLHTHSHRDTLSPTCHGLLNVNSHPLSKSSSSLICSGQSSLEETQSNKQELRKSHSSTVCQTLGNESDARSVPSPRWSFSQSGLMVPDGSVVQTMSNLSPDNNSQSRTKPANHFLIVEQSPASWEVGDAKMCMKSSTVENISSACTVHQHSTRQIEEPGIALQRSHSDLTCSCKQQNYIAHVETSATHSSLSSSSSKHGPSVARMSFQSERDASDTNENTSHFQNLGTHLPAIPTDQKVPTNSFDSGGIPRNTTVYTDPGTFHGAVLGPHMPGNGFPNRTMFSQATGIIHGGLIYGNVPNSAYSPMVVPVHNSAAPCNIRQDSCLKVDATVPAYCHSLPIPSIQLVPRLVCSVSESGKEQAAPGYFHSFSTSDILTYPKLVSSVSESGLDAKRVLKCCSIPGEQLQHAQHCTQQERSPEAQAACAAFSNHQGTDVVMKTKDMWTMTSVNDLTKGLKAALERRDAEVQTLPTMECKSVATSPAAAAEGHSHVFPEVNLEQQDLEAPKSPVREVRWDDEGMTWEVYGASVDPEVLGLAIQKHLEIQIEQFQTEPLQLAGKRKEDSFNKETTSDKMGKKRPFRTMMHSLRYPSCCTRSSAAVE